jgi:hypothetical protein
VPQPLLRQWRHDAPFGSDYIRNHGGVKEQREYEARFIGRMQEWLDAGMRACHTGGQMCARKSKVVCCNSTGTVMRLTRLF